MKIVNENTVENKTNGDDKKADKEVIKQIDKCVDENKNIESNKQKTIKTAPVFMKNRKLPKEKNIVEENGESTQNPSKLDSPLPKGQQKLTDLFKKPTNKNKKSKPVLGNVTSKIQETKKDTTFSDSKNSSVTKIDFDKITDVNELACSNTADVQVMEINNNLNATNDKVAGVEDSKKVTLDMISKEAVDVPVNDVKKLNKEPPKKKAKISKDLDKIKTPTKMKTPKKTLNTPTRKSSRDRTPKKVEPAETNVTPKNKPKRSSAKKSSEKKKQTDEEKRKVMEERIRRTEEIKREKEQKALERKRKSEEDKKRKEEEKLQLQKKREAEKEARMKKKREEEEAKKQKRLEEAETRRKKKEEEELKKKLQKEKAENERKLKLEEKEKAKKMALEKKLVEKMEKERLKKEQDEERQRAIEAEQKKKEKASELFKSFFKPIAKVQPKTKVAKFGVFDTYQLKDGVSIAQVNRRVLEEDEKKKFDESFAMQVNGFASLKSFTDNAKRRIKDDSKQLNTSQTVIERKKFKLFMFHTNYRPPYYGTWKKKSCVISAKNPFKKDEELLDYEYDSDDDWEEPVEGEDIANSDGEEEASGEEEESGGEEDGFFVPHGYLSDDEGIREEDDDDENANNQEISDQKMKAKQLEFERRFKQKIKVLTPISIGCVYEDSSPKLIEQHQQFLSKLSWAFFDDSIVSPYNLENEKPAPKPKEVKKEKPPKVVVSKDVPEEAICDLVRLCHCNPHAAGRLATEFQSYWDLKIKNELPPGAGPVADGVELHIPVETVPEVQSSSKATGVIVQNKENRNFSISKGKLIDKIKAICIYGKGHNLNRKCWFAIDEVLEKYSTNKSDIPVPYRWGWVTKPPSMTVEINVPSLPKAETSPKSAAKEPEETSKVAIVTEPQPANPLPEKPLSNPMKKFLQNTDATTLLQNFEKKKIEEKKLKRRVAFETVTTKVAAEKVLDTSEVLEQKFGLADPQAIKSFFSIKETPEKKIKLDSSLVAANKPSESNKLLNKNEKKTSILEGVSQISKKEIKKANATPTNKSNKVVNGQPPSNGNKEAPAATNITPKNKPKQQTSSAKKSSEKKKKTDEEKQKIKEERIRRTEEIKREKEQKALERKRKLDKKEEDKKRKEEKKVKLQKKKDENTIDLTGDD